MKVFQKTISVQTHEPNEFIEITSEIEKVVSESKIKNGMTFVNALHTTTAVIIQENDSRIHDDLMKMFERIAPVKERYSHDDEGSLNATAHLKSNLLGNHLTIPIQENKLVLGTWQSIFFVELFESRNRKVMVTVIGE